MFNQIRQWFTALTSATIVNLTARLNELEQQVQYEFDFGCKMAARYSATCEELRETKESYGTTLESLKTYATQLTKSEDAYRSLLSDYAAKESENRLLRLKNERLNKQLKEAIELNASYAELTEVYYNSYTATRDELALARSRQLLYRDCLIDNQ